MTDTEYLKRILDDSLHPDTTSVWVAAVVVTIALLLMLAMIRQLREWRPENPTSHEHKKATRAHRQKQHEGERW